jgi:hypothetical protein
VHNSDRAVDCPPAFTRERLRKTLIAGAVVLVVACGQKVAGMPAVAVPQPRPFQPPSSWSLVVSNREAIDVAWQFTTLDSASLKDGAAEFT